MADNKIVRFAPLYRVSSKQQLEDDDIPMQRREIEKFVSNYPGGILLEDKQYYEKGITAYKKSVFDREELMQIYKDAQNGEFDVLIAYMFDRLGRTGLETAYFIYLLLQTGIKIYTIREGWQDASTQIGQIMLAINASSAQEESKKTSYRVDTDHRQMVIDNIYRGGSPPYGYKLVKSSELGYPIYNKKKKELMCLVINEDEAKNVKTMFDLRTTYKYGTKRIARKLNESGNKTREGREWSSSTIRRILENPIYKGCLVYGRTSQKTGKQIRQDKQKWIIANKPNPNWIIISEEQWNLAQIINEENKYIKNDNYEPINPTKSSLLLTGLIFCGSCGHRLTSKTFHRTWTNKDGTKKVAIRQKYACISKQLGKICNGRTIYAKDMIEDIVLNEVFIYLDKLKKINFKDYIAERHTNYIKEIENKIKTINKQITIKNNELNALKKEVAKSLIGQSKFDSNLLSELIQDVNTEINKLNLQLVELETTFNQKKLETNSLEQLQQIIPNWKDVFNNADIDKKKIMLAYIIDKVIVYNDKIEIKINMHIEKLLSLNDMQKVDKWESNSQLLTYIKNILKEDIAIPLEL
jgi:DNA invertase Pin-like site-specific DNA recombinase